MTRFWTLAAALGLATVAVAPQPVWAQDDFYKGKTVSVVIGAKTGSLAVAAQIVTRHL